MHPDSPEVSADLLMTFSRHDRRYCIFSFAGSDEEYLYYSHTARPLMALMSGRDFSGHLPGLLKRDDLCIECGLYQQMLGGVALDNGDLTSWNCTIDDANRVIRILKDNLRADGEWVGLF